MHDRRQKASELVLAFVMELDRSSAFLRAVKELQHRSTPLKPAGFAVLCVCKVCLCPWYRSASARAIREFVHNIMKAFERLKLVTILQCVMHKAS